jgi:cell pole-organizing protein PopZ
MYEVVAMPREHRVTIRLDEALYAQLAARSSREQPLAAIVRQILIDYLARQPDEPTSAADLEETVAAMAAGMQDLREQVQTLTARLDMVAATWQPIAAMEQESAAERQSAAATGEEPAASSQPMAAIETPTAADTAPTAEPTPADSPRVQPRGERKLTATQRRELHRKRARGTPMKALMQEYGLSRATLYRYLAD